MTATKQSTDARPARISGLAFHCHHDILLEYVYDYQERVEAIKRDKPASEQELRLRLFRMIPEEKLPGRESPEFAALTKTRAACEKTRAAHEKTRAALTETRAAFDKAGAAFEKAGAAHAKAWAAHEKTRAAFDKAGAACEKAGAAHAKAGAALTKTRAAHAKAWAAFDKAGAAFDKARAALTKTRAAHDTKFAKELRWLHEELCPDCPWDGMTIFSRRDNGGKQ